MSRKILFEKTYGGFEDVVDMERDIYEMWYDADIVPEFQGKVKVCIWYEPTKEEQETEFAEMQDGGW